MGGEGMVPQRPGYIACIEQRTGRRPIVHRSLALLAAKAFGKGVDLLSGNQTLHASNSRTKRRRSLSMQSITYLIIQMDMVVLFVPWNCRTTAWFCEAG